MSSLDKYKQYFETPTVKGKNSKISCHVYDENKPVDRMRFKIQAEKKGILDLWKVSWKRKSQSTNIRVSFGYEENCHIEIEAKEARASTDVTYFVDLQSEIEAILLWDFLFS